MKITAMQVQVRNPDRVNISIDGSYAFSLSIAQVADLKLSANQEIDDDLRSTLEGESVFGKLYQRTLEYVLMRPRSTREVSDYLYKKTMNRPVRSRSTGDVRMVEGVSASVTQRVLDELMQKGYIDDRKFAEFWVRQRFVSKGVSARKLRSELMAKGVSSGIIDEALRESDRDDASELEKVIAKRRHRYDDETKFMQYLARQGFSYDDIKEALRSEDK